MAGKSAMFLALSLSAACHRNASFVVPAVLTFSRHRSRVLLAIRRKLPSFAECPELHAQGRCRTKDQAKEEIACHQSNHSSDYYTGCVGDPDIRGPEQSRLLAPWRMQHAQGSKVGFPRNALMLKIENRTFVANL